MNEDEFAQCQQEAMSMMSSQFDEGCATAYSEEEMEWLGQIGEISSGIMCLKKIFSESCAQYIEGEMLYMIQSFGTMPAGK